VRLSPRKSCTVGIKSESHNRQVHRTNFTKPSRQNSRNSVSEQSRHDRHNQNKEIKFPPFNVKLGWAMRPACVLRPATSITSTTSNQPRTIDAGIDISKPQGGKRSERTRRVERSSKDRYVHRLVHGLCAGAMRTNWCT